jgi:sugar phosphate isomerase/epimerase
MDFVEIGIEGPEGMPDILMNKAEAIKKSLKKKGMFALGHTVWYNDLGAPYEPVRRAWFSESKRFIDAASQVGMSRISFHSHSSGMFMQQRESKKRVFENFITNIRELVEYGKKKKIIVMLENANMVGEIYDIDDFGYIVSRVPELKVHVDVGHAFIHGGVKNVEAYLRRFSDKLEHLHFHDNHGEFDEHLSIGEGNINYKRVVGVLKKIVYDKTITFEVFNKNRNLVKVSANKVKKMWKS